MSRSGYVDEMDDQWALIRWRGAVQSAIRGKRGQAFLREMLAALDALPNKRLISEELVTQEGEVCGMGAVCVRRGLDMTGIDPYDCESVAAALGIAPALAAEVAYVNDEQCAYRRETPEQRFISMRRWVEAQLVGMPG